VGRALGRGAPVGRDHAPLPGPAHHLPRASQRDVADSTLRQLARWLVAETDVAVVSDITRTTSRTTRLAGRPAWLHRSDPGKNTQRQRLRMIRIFFERLIEWDWPEAHHRNPILHGTSHPSEPLPKFLSDEDAAKLLAAAKAHACPAIAWWSRCCPGPACGQPSSASWRPTQSRCATGPTGCASRRQAAQRPHDPAPRRARPLLEEWTARNRVHIRDQQRLMADEHKPSTAARHGSWPHGKKAGIGHAIPPAPSHTGTQAINRGMRLETIARCSATGHGHDPRLCPDRNRVVADEYNAVMEGRRALQDGGGSDGSAREGETPAMTAPNRVRPHARQRHVQPTGRTRLPD